MGGIDKGESEVEERERIAKDLKVQRGKDKWQKVIWIVMGLIAIASIWVNIWLSTK